MGEIGAVLRQSFKHALEDNIAGEAAKAAYFFFLSFFPLILALFAFAGIFGQEAWFDAIMARVREAAPGETQDILQGLVSQIAEESAPELLSVGLLLALWSASNIFAALTDGLNAMYDLEEDRSWWKRRGLALVALVLAVLLLLPAAVAILAGPRAFGLDWVPPWWGVARWPVAFAALVGVMWVLYYLLPNREQGGVKGEVLVGALVGTSLWLLATLLFRVYVANFGSYGETYGVLGGIIILLLWLYLTALTILFGGEVAAVLEQRRHPKQEVGEGLPGSEGLV